MDGSTGCRGNDTYLSWKSGHFFFVIIIKKSLFEEFLFHLDKGHLQGTYSGRFNILADQLIFSALVIN